MSRDAAALLGVLGGRPTRSADGPVPPQVGVVRSATAAGVTFVLPDYDDGRHVFGPAPWHQGHAAPTPHSHAVSHSMGGGPAEEVEHVHGPQPPVVGRSCLVVFVGTGIERPVVVAWW